MLTLHREKYKLKEREEIWHKIEELARQNPQVCSGVVLQRQTSQFFTLQS